MRIAVNGNAERNLRGYGWKFESKEMMENREERNYSVSRTRLRLSTRLKTSIGCNEWQVGTDRRGCNHGIRKFDGIFLFQSDSDVFYSVAQPQNSTVIQQRPDSNYLRCRL
jgi:hypothetical protein